ncbi:MAG: response regulator transcription factor, partial [Deltaproteobacteria bacterium]
PRVAILDWMMPIMDGIEVCRRIRALKTDRPPYIIMLTTRTEKVDIVAGLEAGADDYLIKPCALDELRARVGVARRVNEMQDIVAAKIGELNEALDHIKAVQGNPPICSCCRKTMDGQA